MQILGIDIGFGFTKVTDGRNAQVFKSVLGDPADIQFREQLLDADGNPEPHRHIQTEDGEYFVGALAESQSRGRTFTLDQEQLIVKSARSLALAAAAPMVDSGEPVRVVTGLPISYYRAYRSQITNLLQQRHEVTLVNAAGERTDTVINIDRVRVVPQPFGSLFNALLNDMGRSSNPEFAKQKIGIIDVGFRTADYTISDKTRYSERGSQSADAGISRAFQAISAALQEKSGVNVELYRLFDAVKQGSIKIRGRTFELQGITQHAFERLANSIATDVNQLWADDWDIDGIMITGGGGRALAPILKPMLQGEVMDDDLSEDARLKNVKGYWKYGVNQWNK